MNNNEQDINRERVATVVGGKGQLGRRMVKAFESIGFGQVRVCEKDDPFLDFAKQSTDIFFAVDDRETLSMLRAVEKNLTPEQTISDGSSVKGRLIPIFTRLDKSGISVASTHLGSVPQHPWRGVKVWVCEVGPNSERAKNLALDLFISTNSSISIIDIKDHKNVEKAQWITTIAAHLQAGLLRRIDFPLGNFNAS